MRPHKLRENKRGSFPRHLIIFDTETTPVETELYQQHLLRLGYAKYVQLTSTLEIRRQDEIVFKTEDEFWQFVEAHTYEKTCLYIFAHNVDFDMSVVRGYSKLRELGYDVQKWFVHNNGVFIKAKKGRKSVVITDTLMLFPFSLKEIGKYAGLEKLDMPNFEDEESKWIEYCKRDVEVLTQALLKYMRFLKEHDLGNFQFTIASQSFSAFRHRFMKHEIYIHGNPSITELEVQSYFGGRTEAFKIGKVDKRLYYLDVNSMYPFVMRNYYYPVRYIGELDNVSLSELKELIKDFCVIADVTVETDVPIVPVRKEKVIFPVGRFRGVYATGEIKLLLEKKKIKEVHKVLVYQRARIFTEYVDFFYAVKQKAKEEGDDFSYFMAKLFLNSLYGKFGQRTSDLELVTDDPIKLEEYALPMVSFAVGEEKFVRFDEKIWRVKKREPAYNSFIAIASHVTSYARAYLFRLMEYVGLDKIYYMDTDSLVVDEEGYQKLKRFINKTRLGALDVKEIFDSLIILGAKAYITPQARRIKGIPARARQIDDNTYEFDQFMRFRTKLRKNMLDCQLVVKATRTLSRIYDKGEVLPNGDVIPFVVVEGR